jgi:hypothetical protein
MMKKVFFGFNHLSIKLQQNNLHSVLLLFEGNTKQNKSVPFFEETGNRC